MRSAILLLTIVLLAGCYARPPVQVAEVTGEDVTVAIWNSETPATYTFSGTQRLKERGKRTVVSSPNGLSLIVLEIVHKGPQLFSSTEERILQTYTAQPDEEVTLTWN